MLHAD